MDLGLKYYLSSPFCAWIWFFSWCKIWFKFQRGKFTVCCWFLQKCYSIWHQKLVTMTSSQHVKKKERISWRWGPHYFGKRMTHKPLCVEKDKIMGHVEGVKQRKKKEGPLKKSGERERNEEKPERKKKGNQRREEGREAIFRNFKYKDLECTRINSGSIDLILLLYVPFILFLIQI